MILVDFQGAALRTLNYWIGFTLGWIKYERNRQLVGVNEWVEFL